MPFNNNNVICIALVGSVLLVLERETRTRHGEPIYPQFWWLVKDKCRTRKEESCNKNFECHDSAKKNEQESSNKRKEGVKRTSIVWTVVRSNGQEWGAVSVHI